MEQVGSKERGECEVILEWKKVNIVENVAEELGRTKSQFEIRGFVIMIVSLQLGGESAVVQVL